VIALLFTFFKSSLISKKDPGTEKMQKIASHISEGAMAFLKSEYKILPVFVIC
jgi:K(+)-stimulated pyrophosphate-energized sodium pump